MGEARRRREHQREQEFAIHGMGIEQRVDAGPKINGPVPEWTGAHFWAMVFIHRVNPAKMLAPGAELVHFDTESLVTSQGPVCLHCASSWPADSNRCTNAVPD
jgi:hypothetical protein